MKRSWIAAVVVTPIALLGAEKPTCPMAATTLRLTRSLAPIYQQLSANAEAVASSSRHRAVTPPARGDIIYPVSANFIDDAIFGKMKKDGVAPAPISAETAFLRRVSLDLTCQGPTPAVVK